MFKKNIYVSKPGKKTESVIKMEEAILKYLKEHHEKNKKIMTQTELAALFTEKSSEILGGVDFKVSQDRVSRLMNDKGYTRNRKTGKLEKVTEYIRQDLIDTLSKELSRLIEDESIKKNPDIYTFKCELFMANHLKYYIEQSFPNEVLGIFTNDTTLMILVDPTYTPQEKELGLKKFLEDAQLSILSLRN